MVRNKSYSGGNASTSTSSSKSPSKKNHRKQDSSCDSISSNEDLTGACKTSTPPSTWSSVHKQNLYIVSFPIIFLFNILRSLIYQLFCIFCYIYSTSSRVIYRPVIKKDTNLEIVVGCNNSNNLEQPEQKNISHSHNNIHHHCHHKHRELEMLPNRQSSFGGPGPADPLLAKQKHHHRRAFEYISKALKIDEENEGN